MPQITGTLKAKFDLAFYSYRKASTGFSFAAFLAGYRAKRRLTTIPNTRAPTTHDSERTGVIVKDISLPCIMPLLDCGLMVDNAKLRKWASP